MNTYTARQIAEWFVAWAEEQEDADITNLKLQKLVYYAKLTHMKRTDGASLFSDTMQAWAHGPVVPDLYFALRGYGKTPIDPDKFVSPDFNWDTYRQIEDTLIETWERYGVYSGWALRNKTHTESPWKKNFRNDERNIEISDTDLKEFICE